MAAVKEKLNKKKIGEMLSFKSKSRGVVFQTDAEYVITKYGEDALKKVEKKLKELGHPLSYSKIKASEFYPTGLRVLSLLVIKDVLNLSDEDIKSMGDNAPKISFLIKLMINFFVSLKNAVNKAPDAWSKHHTGGKLVVVEINEAKRFIIARLLDFKTEPIFLKYLEGYYRRFIQFALPNESVKVKLVKSMAEGAEYNEYKIFW